jgi:PncC family amidohydrolase
VYSNEAKTALAGVPAELIEAHGAVSPEVATALSAGARSRLDADYGIGITGIAGPGGGSEAKPVGTVCISVSSAADAEERVVRLPGGRADVRDRTTTIALHMLRSLLLRA